MNSQERLQYLNALLATVTPAWPRITIELQSRIDEATNNLIAADNEQTRGAIKELRVLLALPEALQSERDQITAALSEQDAAH